MNFDPMRRANLLMQQKRFAQAAEAFLEVLAEFPEEPIALASLGWCQTRCGHVDLGEENIQRAIEQAPDSDFVHQIHTLHLSRLGRHIEAELAIRRALDRYPTYPPYLAKLAMTLRNQGQFEKALAAARRGLNADAEDEECLNELLLAQIERNDDAAVYETAQLTLRMDPEDPLALAAMGYCLLQRREFAEAAGAFRDSLRIVPHYEWAKAGLALCPKEYSYWYARTAKIRQLATSKEALPIYAICGLIMLLGVASSVMAMPPRATLFLKLSLLAFFPLAFLAFSAESIAIRLLCFKPVGALLIMPLQRRLAKLSVYLLLGSLLIFAGAILAYFEITDSDSWGLFLLSFCVATPIPPLACAYDCELGWQRSLAWHLTACNCIASFMLFTIVANGMEEKNWLETSFLVCLGLVLLNIVSMTAAIVLPRMSYRQRIFGGESQR